MVSLELRLLIVPLRAASQLYIHMGMYAGYIVARCSHFTSVLICMTA